MNSLQPLKEGVVVLVGVKASNLPNELREHPRIVVWDSQDRMVAKDLPTNARAVFITRFLGHDAFKNIQGQAIKRHITMFHPQGTGMVVRQVKELLNMTTQQKEQEEMATKGEQKGKLEPLVQFIDYTKTNVENARVMMDKAKELNIETTFATLANKVGVLRRKNSGTAIPRSVSHVKDVSLEILDNMIKELQDMRDFIAATVEENKQLKERLTKFKRMLDGE